MSAETISFTIRYLNPRHDKRLHFDTSGFFEDPKLTRKQRDLRQKNYCEKPKNHKILYFWRTNR